MEERHLSLSEAADTLNISERTAYRWIKSGKLRAYKPGRDYWIPESAIKEVVKESVVRPKGAAPPEQQSFNHLLEEERRETPAIEVVDTFFVPLEEGEEEDTVTLKIYHVRVFEGDEPILKAMREVSPEEEAAIRRQLEKAGRARE